MQSEKDKIMELLTITEVKEGGEVIFTDRSIEILQELGQQYKETPLFKKSRQDNGIITALNLTGSFVSWGNETACYPANTDVTDYFYCVSRMFSWVANSVILSMWSKVDKKLNKRLIESVTQSINIWLNGLMAEEKILGGRVEFLEEENTTTDLLAGKAKFHIYLTPPSPAKELDFVLEYDVSYLENIFA